MNANARAKGLFVTDDGQNVMFTFILLCSLFLLWGVCNGMIDVMDKHFQEVLHLSKSQSAWVQFAHYLGYFLMSLPAGWLAIKLGYKGGIIAGLLIVAVGGFWFIPATRIAAFWAFLLGVCMIASGLTFLETVCNPYTTVLGDQRFAATRINLAQSCNGVITLGQSIEGTRLWLRSVWGLDGRSQYFFSLDGRAFAEFGSPYPLAWGNYRGDRIGLYSFNSKADEGYVDVNYFRYNFAQGSK